MLLIVDESASVLASIRLCENSLSVFLVVSPVAIVDFTVVPGIFTFPVNHAIFPFSEVLIFVSPDTVALSMLDTCKVHALVAASIGPKLDSVTIHESLHPVSLILRAVDLCELAHAVGFVVLPVAIVDISIGMVEDARAMLHVALPLALILVTV